MFSSNFSAMVCMEKCWSAPMPQRDLAGLSVLIVEDVRATRLILRTILRGLGIVDVVEACDGMSALELLGTRKVDIVITDICMAPMDGMEFTRRLRKPCLLY